jgi:hypothetical protein
LLGRVSLWETSGETQVTFVLSDSTTTPPRTNLYPKKIPTGKTSVTVSTAVTNQFVAVFSKWDGTSTTVISSTGWVNVNGQSISIPNNATQFTLAFRVNSSDSYYTPTKVPADVSLQFS